LTKQNGRYNDGAMGKAIWGSIILPFGLAILAFIAPLIVRNMPYWLKIGLLILGIVLTVAGLMGFLVNLFRERRRRTEKTPRESKRPTPAQPTQQVSQVAGNVTAVSAGRDVHIAESKRDLTQKVEVQVHLATPLGKGKDGEYTQELGEPRYCIKVRNSSPESEVEVTHIEYSGSSTVPVGLGDGSLPRRLKVNETAEWLVRISEIPNDQRPKLKFRVQLSDGSVFWSQKNLNVFEIGNVSDQTKNIVTGIKYLPDDPKDEGN
jgi:hypothetical protein